MREIEGPITNPCERANPGSWENDEGGFWGEGPAQLWRASFELYQWETIEYCSEPFTNRRDMSPRSLQTLKFVRLLREISRSSRKPFWELAVRTGRRLLQIPSLAAKSPPHGDPAETPLAHSEGRFRISECALPSSDVIRRAARNCSQLGDPTRKKTLTWSKTQTDEGKLGFNSARSSALVQFRSRLWRRKCIEEFNLKCFKAKRRKCVEEFDLKCSKLDEKMSVGVSMKLKFRSLLGETKVKRRTGQKFRRSARLARSRPDEGGPSD